MSLENPSKTEEVLINPDSNLWILSGVPSERSRNSAYIHYEIPSRPHVIDIDEVRVTSSESSKLLVMQNVRVIYCHGVRVKTETGIAWKFANGDPVTEVVKSFSEYASQNNQKPIELIVSCNEDLKGAANRHGLRRAYNFAEKLFPSLGIRIHDLDQRLEVAYTYGSLLYASLDRSLETGKLILTIEERPETEFHGLSDLAYKKEIEQQIKI